MARLLFGFILTAAGAAHFKRPRFFSRMIPFLGRARMAAVYLSGVAEAVLGILLLINKGTAWTGKAVSVLMVLVFPANLYMAVTNMPLKKNGKPKPLLLWMRVLLQWPLITSAWKLSSYRK
ncbi:putative membrane protein [Sinobaca qinghaiensis]|uniref:Putative membrane protein n=1 Tax=Sinobaca qinghaiensis TaxID=342944 RepID=A0A419V4E1_9BACL|nr:hypothetical protein [Sinobaca qinghaiensis]RKD73389.1 putative membrane protein [Sinobaca qinghaiensis]